VSKNEDSEKGTSETLEKLISLMSARELAQGVRDELAEKRTVKTDDKIDTLVSAVNTLTISHTESQRDNKEIFKAIERLEENQKQQGVKQSAQSEVLAVHEVKINGSKSVLREAGGVITAIIAAVLIGKFSI